MNSIVMRSQAQIFAPKVVAEMVGTDAVVTVTVTLSPDREEVILHLSKSVAMKLIDSIKDTFGSIMQCPWFGHEIVVPRYREGLWFKCPVCDKNISAKGEAESS